MDKKCPTLESGMAGKAESCQGCPNAKLCANSKPDEDIPIIIDNLKKVKLILAVMSGKGGVGKSTISCNIARSLAKKGLKTMILDLDLSGPSIPRLTNTLDEFIYSAESYFKPINITENLSSMSVGYLENNDESRVFNSATKNFVLKKIFKFCDFDEIEIIVLDTPPNITDEHLALASYIKPNFGIVVTTPQKLSIDDVRRQITFCKKTGIRILGILENMKYFQCSKCNHFNRIFNEVGVQELCIDEELKYLGSIPLKTSYAKASDSGNSFDETIFDEITLLIQDELKKLN